MPWLHARHRQCRAYNLHIPHNYLSTHSDDPAEYIDSDNVIDRE